MHGSAAIDLHLLRLFQFIECLKTYVFIAQTRNIEGQATGKRINLKGEKYI